MKRFILFIKLLLIWSLVLIIAVIIRVIVGEILFLRIVILFPFTMLAINKTHNLVNKYNLPC